MASAKAGTAKCLRAYWEEGEEQGTTGMYFATGRTCTTDFPLDTTLAEIEARFEHRDAADFRGKVMMVFEDGSETAHTFTQPEPTVPDHDLQLYYWNGRGLLEVGRMLLAAAGKKAGVDYA